MQPSKSAVMLQRAQAITSSGIFYLNVTHFIAQMHSAHLQHQGWLCREHLCWNEVGWLSCFNSVRAPSPSEQRAQGEIPVSKSHSELREIRVLRSQPWSLSTGSRNPSGILHITQQHITLTLFSGTVHTTMEIMLSHTTGRGGFPPSPSLPLPYNNLTNGHVGSVSGGTRSLTWPEDVSAPLKRTHSYFPKGHSFIVTITMLLSPRFPRRHIPAVQD